MSAPTPPRAFRRRLFTVLALAVLLPVGAWGLFSEAMVDRLLGLSLAPLDGLLERIEQSDSIPAELRGQTQRSRLLLAQAELARRSLGKVAPRIFGGLVALSALAFAGAALLVVRRLTRPVEALTVGMARFAEGDLDHRVPEPSEPARDEMAFLISRFNRMGDELVAQREQLRAIEKLAGWQEVARALAHELKNPLTAMRMAVGRIAKAQDGAGSSAAVSESLALLEDEIELLIRLTHSFSSYAQLPPPSRAPLDLAAVVNDVCALYGSGPVPVRRVDGPDGAAEARLTADADQLRRALGNLVKNALEATGASGEAVEVELARDVQSWVVAVRDRGPGVGRNLEGTELLRGLVSTKPGGSGLGLPIAAKIAADHGGTVRLLPRVGGGTEARLSLPLSG